MSVSHCILVVEDDSSVQEFTRLVLSDEGYEVMVASNGLIALQQIARRQPNLILLDLWMPVMDGRTFLEAYQKLPGYHAPVISFSAATIKGRPSLPLSVIDFLPKPFDLEDLLEMVKRNLHQEAPIARVD